MGLTVDQVAEKYNVRRAQVLRWRRECKVTLTNTNLICDDELLKNVATVHRGETPDGYLSASECIEKIGVSAGMLTTMIQRGRLDALRVGGRVFVKNNELVAEAQANAASRAQKNEQITATKSTKNNALNALMGIFRCRS